MIKRIHERLARDKIKAKIIPVARANDLKNWIEEQHRRGIIFEGVYKQYYPNIKFNPFDSLPGAKSIIVAAVPRPITKATFAHRGKEYNFYLPPTYSYNLETTQDVMSMIKEIIAPAGYHIAVARLPEKMLTVCSGLGEYGRNNISYVPGMGSFHQPVAYYTDMEPEEDSWREPAMMDVCLDCFACMLDCPSGAIPEGKFQLDASRCIVFYHEVPGDFPAWLKTEWYEYLIGCMYCQRVCPVNEPFIDWVGEEEYFTEEETALILNNAMSEEKYPETFAKMRRFGIENMKIIPRNLRILMER
ncbi:MAG: 4Fe-4S double cluster binding domain-containing protein [Candidatus Zixiibacteriota bacterium]